MSIIDKFADLFYPKTNVRCESIENIDPNAARKITDEYNTQTVKDSDMVGIYDSIKKESSLGGNYIQYDIYYKKQRRIGEAIANRLRHEGYRANHIYGFEVNVITVQW